MEPFLGWVHPFLSNYPLVAPIVFIGAHILMAVLFLPCSPMTLIAGALWGSLYGLIISILAAILSTATTFILSRSILHSRIEKFLINRYPKIADLLAQVPIHDWKLIAVSQLNPLIPASTMGYAFGLSRITLARYLLLSGIFMLPLQVLFVVTGYSITQLFLSDGQWGITLALISLVIIVSLASKHIFRKICRLFGIIEQ